METLKLMMDGQPVAVEQATIPVMDHGFLFGDCIYEVLRSRNGQPFLWATHLKRLHYSASQIDLELPCSDDVLRAEFQTMIDAFEGQDLQMRFIVTRGVGPLSHEPGQCIKPCRILIARPLTKPSGHQYAKGVALYREEATNPMEKGHIKSGNVKMVLALHRAQQLGFYEAIRLNPQGKIAECATSNLFWFDAAGVLHTPSVEAGILKGVTRELVLYLAVQAGFPLQEGLYTWSDLQQASEVFITSTSRGILPVSRIGNQIYAVGSNTQTLMDRLERAPDIELDF
ncbi:MAG: aminotransferase class IV [Acidobacteria bacterium]|nr:aminotransferase class IV [Acidobacteriota bacterium]MCB9397877.1 aminotransferase class IV [Acidobacteriota bacterium]